MSKSKAQPTPCACGCGELAWGKYKRHHYEAWVREHKLYEHSEDPRADALVETINQVVGYKGPPDHPAPIDHRRWRLASDRPSTPKSNPWIKTKCHECLNEMWTRDPLSTWQHGGFCEECEYMLRTEMQSHGQRHWQIQQRTQVDPFRPR